MEIPIRPGKVAIFPLIFRLQRHRGDWTGADGALLGEWPEEACELATRSGAVIHHHGRRTVYFSYPGKTSEEAGELARAIYFALEDRRLYYQRLLVGISCRKKDEALLTGISDLEEEEREDFLSRRVDFMEYYQWVEKIDPINTEIGIPTEEELEAIEPDERKAYAVRSLLRAYAEELQRVHRDEYLLQVMEIPESDLIRLHFDLGLMIRNLWCLRDDDDLPVALRPHRGGNDPDHVSQLVIHAFWKHLTHGKLSIEAIDRLLDHYDYPHCKSRGTPPAGES